MDEILFLHCLNHAGDVVLTAVLCGDLIDVAVHRVEGWIANDDGGRSLCAAHFRADACHARRCKLSHANSIALMRNVECSDSADTACEEPWVSRVDDISTIPRADFSRLHFLFVDGVCVFDYKHENNWNQWKSSFLTERRVISKLDCKPSVLSPILESNVALDELDLPQTDTVEQTVGTIKISEDNGKDSYLAIVKLFPRVLCLVLSFCLDVELCRMAETCTELKLLIESDELLSFRKRDYLASVSLTGKDLKKMRKKEKKKKLKAANYNKLPKKDGYRV